MSKSNSSFPTDVVSEILQKLPTKSIVRSRCVSKLWSSITTDSYFINSFGLRSSQNVSLLYISKKSKKLFFFSSSNNKSQHLDHYQPKSICFSSMESSHGLICFRGSAESTLWNPTMRQFLNLRKPKKRWTKQRTTLFIGYDPIEGKHKVVSMPREEFCDKCMVLTLGVQKSYWRRIKTNLYHKPLPATHGKGQCINGVLYYKAFDHMKNQVVVCFDVRSEKFQLITVPLPLGTKWGLLIAYDEGRLALVYNDYGKNLIKLCILEDTEKHAWSHKSFHAPLNHFDSSLELYFQLGGVTDGGEFIYVPLRSMFHKSLAILYFDPKRGNFRNTVLDRLGEESFKVLQVFPNLIESLISLGPGVGVGVDDKPNPWEFGPTQFDNILKTLKAVSHPCARFLDEESDEKDTFVDTCLPAKRKREEIIQEPKIKLKNLCKQILVKDGGSMKLKQLKSLIDEQAPSVLSEFSSRKDAIAYLKLKLERSGKFVVEGKRISFESRKK